jgi:RHS repeat-associated protein
VDGAEDLFRYTGHERDVNCEGCDPEGLDDLDYMQARMYSPAVGRFLGVDPLRSSISSRPLTWNKYIYARGNPLVFVDPDGGQERSTVQAPVLDPIKILKDPLGSLLGRGALYLVDSDTEKRLRAIRESSERAAAITGVARSLLPKDASKALSEIESGENRPNVRDPDDYDNDGRGGTFILPTHDENGDPITYTEHTVNPKDPVRGHDKKRFVTGSDGSIYYTEDHYESFKRVNSDQEFVRDVEPIEP